MRPVFTAINTPGHRRQRLSADPRLVSGNPFYLYDLGDKYAVQGLGADRDARIAPLGGLVKRKVAVGLHSDFPMAPAEPLFLAWTAASRETMSGKVFAPEERLTLEFEGKAYPAKRAAASKWRSVTGSAWQRFVLGVSCATASRQPTRKRVFSLIADLEVRRVA